MAQQNPKIMSTRAGVKLGPRWADQAQEQIAALEAIIVAHPHGRFRIRHVATGNITEGSVSAVDAMETIGGTVLSATIFEATWTLGHLMRLLDRWNKMSPGTWVYEAVNDDPGPVTIQPIVNEIAAR